MASSKEEMDHKLTFRKYEEGDYMSGETLVTKSLRRHFSQVPNLCAPHTTLPR